VEYDKLIKMNTSDAFGGWASNQSDVN
jgi:hypothetical protein